MKKILSLLLPFLFFCVTVNAREPDTYELGVGVRIQKTEQLYWENGAAVDYTSGFLLHKQVHLKLSYVTSRLGNAFTGNAVKQDNYIVGADWHFRSTKAFQIFAGLNTGFFHADMETQQFNVLPHNSILFSLEAGLYYKFKFPLAAGLSAGYNLINGNGVSTPGTLFPVFYQLSVFYRLH
jgi:hypothetical protein